jgi:hypothetical protein
MNNIELEYLIDSNELVIRFIKKNKSTKYFYSIYGDNNLNLKGMFDVSDDNVKHIPRVIIDVGVNTIFFIKFKYLINDKIIEEFKFVELEKLKKKQNLSMNILDKKTDNLFKSINMDDEDNSDNDNSDNDNSDNDNSIRNNSCNDSSCGDSDTDPPYGENIQLLNRLITPINEVINIELMDTTDNLNEHIENL